jgi:signal transduction histidine kinase
VIRERVRGRLGAKLFLAQLLVIVAGSVTLLLVALAVAPGRFRGHVHEVLGAVPDDVQGHLDQAFDDALLVALAVAIGAALVAALAVSLFLSLRVVRPIQALAEAAQRIAKGAYGARVPSEGTDELAVLGSAFNAMAASLESAERRRRELLSDVAHELRNPLATIDGYLEGLDDGIVQPSRDTWTVLQKETRRLRRLVEDLSTVSRAEERQLDLHMAPCDPAELLGNAAEAARPAFADKRVLLEATSDRPLPEIPADRDRIGEVLANLLDNALRHTAPGGRVRLGAQRTPAGLELSVTDDGEGIAAEHLPRVFERFYRADPARTRDRGGSGIGLAIAKALVEAHGGTIRAESDGPGRGASFVVMLPLATESARPVSN